MSNYAPGPEADQLQASLRVASEVGAAAREELQRRRDAGTLTYALEHELIARIRQLSHQCDVLLTALKRHQIP